MIVNPDRWAVPLLAILGGLGLAGWSIYWDYQRRLPGSRIPLPEFTPVPDERPGSHDRLLEAALSLLAASWLMRFAADRLGEWMAMAGYAAFVAGVALLATHVGRRLSSGPRGSGNG